MAGGHPDPMAVQRSPSKPLAFYMSSGKRWIPSVATYGIFSGMMFLYFTDWKVFMDKVPFYRKKFEPQEPLV